MKLKIQYVPILTVKPYWRNPKKGTNVPELKESIKQNGFRNPIQVDKEMVIIAGHSRYRAAVELDIKEIPVIVQEDMSPEQVQRYRILDNRIQERNEYDADNLQLELRDWPAEDVRFFFPEIKLDNADLVNFTGVSDEQFENREQPLSDVIGNNSTRNPVAFHDKITCPYCLREFSLN